MEDGFTAEDLSKIEGIATISLLYSFIPTQWLPFSIVGRAKNGLFQDPFSSGSTLLLSFNGIMIVWSADLCRK